MTVAHLLTLLSSVLATMGVPTSQQPLAPKDPILIRAAECAADVIAVVPEGQRATWAPILFVFAMKEGGCHASPPGSNDHGKACGVLQVHEPQRYLPGATCAAVRADRRLGLRVGFAIMLANEQRCGSIAAGLTAYGTKGGTCKPYVLQLVRERCLLAGGVC